MKEPATNLPTLLRALELQHYTGQATLHLKDGVPLFLELLEKKRVALTQDPPRPTLKATG